jgi:hypothetical protein|tara:strand:- start:111 stop:1781 length:1671 start_codon:yes stop_codon:yes gene_type:complete
MKNLTIIILLSCISAQEIDSSYSLKWHNEPWGAGGLFPAGPPWSMVGPYDFNGNGFGDFIVSSSYTGEYCNGIYHYEATGDDSIGLQWVHTFYDLSCSPDNYSSVAIGDLDGDSYMEILSLSDTEPGVPNQNGFQVFEWSTDSSSFLSTPTAAWNMGLDSVWEAGQIFVAELDGDANPEVIVSVMDGPWGATGSSRLIIFELENTDFSDPTWVIEYEDPTWTNWSGYNISVGDLDQDGFMEIYIIGYEYYHIIIYESTGEDAYEYQTDFYVSTSAYERGNQSMIVTDINSDGSNELFAVTSGTNTLDGGTLLSPGYFYAVSGTDDVSQLSFDNFNYFTSYIGGLREISEGDADGDGIPNLYIAGHYNEAVYDWEFVGDDPFGVTSYTEHVIFMDDTTDDFTTTGSALEQDQGKVRVAKLFTGDIDNDGNGDLVFSSASFAADKPHIFMIEHDEELSNENDPQIPSQFNMSQNYPNPFNPSTQFSYTLPESGNIELAIYDIMGKMVYKFHDGFQRAGNHNILWTGVDQNQKTVPSGVYLCQLKMESNTITKKMVMTK